MAASNNTFFDVLIDRLIEDVRREYEAPAETAAPSPFDEPKKIVLGPEDLVSQMIGFRARMGAATPAARNSPARARIHPDKFESKAIETQLAPAERALAKPNFKTARGEMAFAFVTSCGAKFYANDVHQDGISREALKRERRRVLLTVHPDRAPEADRAAAHEKFLAAAEAFIVLADVAADSTLAA